jgi:hypothetical protein
LINNGVKKSYANRDRSWIFRNHCPSLRQDGIAGQGKVGYTEEIRPPSLSQTPYPVIASHYSPLCHPGHTSLNIRTQSWCGRAT